MATPHNSTQSSFFCNTLPIVLKWVVIKGAPHHAVAPVLYSAQTFELHGGDLHALQLVIVDIDKTKNPEHNIELHDLPFDGTDILRALAQILLPKNMCEMGVIIQFHAQCSVLNEYYDIQYIVDEEASKASAQPPSERLIDVKGFEKLLIRQFDPPQEIISLN